MNSYHTLFHHNVKSILLQTYQQNLKMNLKLPLTLFGIGTSLGFTRQYVKYKKQVLKCEEYTTLPKTAPGVNINNNNNVSKQDLTPEEWRRIANQINSQAMIIQGGLEWEWKDYLVYWVLFASSLGLFFLVKPVFNFWIYSKHIQKMRIGRLKPKLQAALQDYIFEVHIPNTVFLIFTFGLFQLFGFHDRFEKQWLDERTKWYLEDDNIGAQN